MPDDFGVTVVTTLVCFLFCMRGCGRIERPAFPAPSEFQMRFRRCKTRADHAARSRRCGCVAVKRGTACVCELRDVIAYSTTASAVFIPPTCGDKKGRPSLRGANATKRSRFPVWCVGPMDCFAALAMTNVKMRLAVWRFEIERGCSFLSLPRSSWGGWRGAPGGVTRARTKTAPTRHIVRARSRCCTAGRMGNRFGFFGPVDG
jgi:hypothetical protein